ncbi:hypothetical protein CL629_01715 [bacterium]|nr:hypothetical protein [bacterium]
MLLSVLSLTGLTFWLILFYGVFGGIQRSPLHNRKERVVWFLVAILVGGIVAMISLNRKHTVLAWILFLCGASPLIGKILGQHF